jgi:acetolactate synthase-1/2/3 large subunit
MNGAECLVGTRIKHGVDHVFTNPGTSEIGLVAEIATTDQIRAVPVPCEGIAAGAPAGYGA